MQIDEVYQQFLRALSTKTPFNKPCPLCGDVGTTMSRRLCTRYEDDSRNILFSCEECYDDHEAYWQERWLEYYSEVL